MKLPPSLPSLRRLLFAVLLAIGALVCIDSPAEMDDAYSVMQVTAADIAACDIDVGDAKDAMRGALASFEPYGEAPRVHPSPAFSSRNLPPDRPPPALG